MYLSHHSKVASHAWFLFRLAHLSFRFVAAKNDRQRNRAQEANNDEQHNLCLAVPLNAIVACVHIKVSKDAHMLEYAKKMCDVDPFAWEEKLSPAVREAQFR